MGRFRERVAFKLNRLMVQLLPIPVSALFSRKRPGHYSKILGYTNARFAQSTEAALHVYGQIFSLFDEMRLKYAVFAGTAVGLVRNGKIMPWMDDIDVIIFEEDISFFENQVLPRLHEGGFNCFPPSLFPNAGIHILALQKSADRADKIWYSKDIAVPVPWAQVDVFYSKYEDGVLRNIAGWGTYDKKEIPRRVVEPFKRATMSGLSFPVFSDVEEYVAMEYGDVSKSVIVRTHDKYFFDSKKIGWGKFNEKFNAAENENQNFGPPSVTRQTVDALPPKASAELRIEPGLDFDSLFEKVSNVMPTTVILSDPEHIFWVMDLKNHFFEIEISVDISDANTVAHAVHLRAFIDKVTFKDSALREKYLRAVSAISPRN